MAAVADTALAAAVGLTGAAGRGAVIVKLRLKPATKARLRADKSLGLEAAGLGTGAARKRHMV
jgi:acyl-coenzyme A thioesterase PaaI-like protein